MRLFEIFEGDKKYPPHQMALLKKAEEMDKRGEWDPIGRSFIPKPKFKHTMTDVTPKGYGPEKTEETEETNETLQTDPLALLMDEVQKELKRRIMSPEYDNKQELKDSLRAIEAAWGTFDKDDDLNEEDRSEIENEINSAHHTSVSDSAIAILGITRRELERRLEKNPEERDLKRQLRKIQAAWKAWRNTQ